MHAHTAAPFWPRIAAVPVAAAITLVGIWLAGGVVTDDFRASMGLTALWFALVALGAVVAWRQTPVLRPAAVVAVATFLVVGGVLALATVRDVTVNERVAVGPAAVSGAFADGAHPTEGTAAVVRTGSGSVLTLTDFRTDAGPDLFVYVVPSGATDAVEGGVRLGGLKGNAGNQQYALPAGLELEGASVVIWCRAFSVAFGAARLSAA